MHSSPPPSYAIAMRAEKKGARRGGSGSGRVLYRARSPPTKIHKVTHHHKPRNPSQRIKQPPVASRAKNRLLFLFFKGVASASISDLNASEKATRPGEQNPSSSPTPRRARPTPPCPKKGRFCVGTPYPIPSLSSGGCKNLLDRFCEPTDETTWVGASHSTCRGKGAYVCTYVCGSFPQKVSAQGPPEKAQNKV